MKTAQLNINVIGIKHTASFELYPRVIPGKVRQTMERMQELGMDKSERYIIYEPKRGIHHNSGFFLTGVAMESGDEHVPSDMDIIQLSGEYAVLETIFSPSKMGEFYMELDKMINESEYIQDQDRFIIELYKELPDEAQALIIYMPVIATGSEDRAISDAGKK